MARQVRLLQYNSPNKRQNTSRRPLPLPTFLLSLVQNENHHPAPDRRRNQYSIPEWPIIALIAGRPKLFGAPLARKLKPFTPKARTPRFHPFFASVPVPDPRKRRRTNGRPRFLLNCVCQTASVAGARTSSSLVGKIVGARQRSGFDTAIFSQRHRYPRGREQSRLRETDDNFYSTQIRESTPP